MSRKVVRLYVIAALLATLCCGCSERAETLQPAVSVAARSFVPFTDAQVMLSDDARYIVRWAMAGNGRVRVYAGTGPNAIGQRSLVGGGGPQGQIVVSSLSPATRWYFALVPEGGHELVVTDRSLHLKHAPNFRDIGGYRTQDGRWVRMGVLFRSDQLNLMNESDLQTVASLDIQSVIDLRQQVERTAKPDPSLGAAQVFVADVLADAGLDFDAMPPGGWEIVSAGRGADLMRELYQTFIRLPSASKAYGSLLTAANDARGGILFHCTAGQDRTGWAAAVLLTALGVPRETVMQDYLLSAPMLAEKHSRLTKQYVAKLEAWHVTAGDLEPLLKVRSDYLNAAFQEVDRRYGSFDNYLRKRSRAG